jgi:hypothetical protein
MPFGIGALLAGGGIISSLIGGKSAGNAAQTQANAANQASQLQLGEFQQILQQLQPYASRGADAISGLGGAIGIQPNGTLGNPYASLLGSSPDLAFNLGGPPVYGTPPTYTPLSYAFKPPTATDFQASPGYNYLLGQSSDAIQNSAAGKTGAISGNMLKALQGNATGLASQDWWNFYNSKSQEYGNAFNANANQNLLGYNSQLGNFNNAFNANNQTYNTQYGNDINLQNRIFNMLNSLSSQGQSAAAGQGAAGLTTAGNIGNNIVGAGNAGAAGIVGAGNAAIGGLNSIPNNLIGGNILSQLIGGGNQNQNSGNNPFGGNNFLNFLLGNNGNFLNPGTDQSLGGANLGEFQF